MLLTWVGGPGSAPHLPPWEESQEQWAVEGWLQRWPAGSQARGWGRGGSVPTPKLAESPSRELTVAGVSPGGGPWILRVSSGEEERDCCDVTSWTEVVQSPPRGVAGSPSSVPRTTPQSAPQSQGGERSQRALFCLPSRAWMEWLPRALIASIRSSILRG